MGKASIIGIEISLTPPLIFTGVKMCEIWRRLKRHSTLSRPHLKMQQDIRTLKQNCNATMIALCQLGPRTHEKAPSVVPNSPPH